MAEKKVLLVTEDDANLREVLSKSLGDSGFNVIQAKDGEECIKTALIDKPDLILLDILMPKIDGLSVMRKLRKTNDWGKNVPIILLTNVSPDKEDINNAIAEHEPAYYLVKSKVSLEDIADKVKERLELV